MTDPMPSLETVPVTLRDGTVAEIRPVMPADAPLLVEGMEALSEESRFARFGIGIHHLTSSELKYLTDVDQRRHVALGATIDGEAAGIARYVVIPDDGCAEVAITVVDRHQRKGLGRALLGALAAVARFDSVDRFCFEVEPENQAVQRLLVGVSGEVDSSGMWRGMVDVADVDPGDNESDVVELIEGYRWRRLEPGE